jgi:hypothetical protein
MKWLVANTQTRTLAQTRHECSANCRRAFHSTGVRRSTQRHHRTEEKFLTTGILRALAG